MFSMFLLPVLNVHSQLCLLLLTTCTCRFPRQLFFGYRSRIGSIWNSQILSAPTFIQHAASDWRLLQVDIVPDRLPPGRTLCEGHFTYRIKSWLALHLKSYLCSAFPVHISCFSCVLSSFPSINHFHPNPLTSEFELWKPNLGCRVKPTPGSRQA